jgi:hypothetical protein
MTFGVGRASALSAPQSQAILTLILCALRFVNHVGRICKRGQNGANQMYLDQDQMAIVRTQLSDQLALLQITSFEANPVPYFLRLETLRKMAQTHDFKVVSEIATLYEDALQRIPGGQSANVLINNFNEALEEAIGCMQVSAQVAEGFLAAIAMRLRP